MTPTCAEYWAHFSTGARICATRNIKSNTQVKNALEVRDETEMCRYGEIGKEKNE